MLRRTKNPNVENPASLETAKEKRVRNKKMLQIQSTQMFSLVRDIRDGIVITKDRRYVKIMEFTPINLALRSGPERDVIASAFAAALKVMPNTVQFKVVTKKADTTKFLEQIVDDLDGEESQGVIDLAAERADMIERIAAHGGVTRRFFIIFEYEDEGFNGTQKVKWTDIRNSLFHQAALIESSLNACGNFLVNKRSDDEWTMEVFYSLLCRAESEIKPFSKRKLEVLARYSERERTGEEEYIPVNNFICPTQINTQLSPRYLTVDGLYYSFQYVSGQSYDINAVAGWARTFIEIGEGVDVDIYIHKERDAATRQKLQFKIRSNKLKLKNSDDSSMDYEDLYSALKAGYHLRQGMADGEEFCYFGIMLTISADTQEALNTKINAIRKHLKKQSMVLRPCWFQMDEALQMSLPLCRVHTGIFRKARRNSLTTSVASLYPLMTSELTDIDGVLFGRNKQSDSLVMANNFDTSKYENANMSILGKTGAGKTFTLLNLLMRYRAKGIQVFAIIPKKGSEFIRATVYNNGQYINISPGSIHNINILDIRRLDTTSQRLLDGDLAISRSRRDAKIDQVRTFFQLILKDISQEELETVDEALKNTYAKFGITEDNESLWDPENPNEYREMPLLGDVYDVLVEMGEDAKRVAKVLKRYVSGSAKSFNQATNVNLDNKFIVFDLNDLTDEMRPIGIFIVLDYIWDKIREDKTQKKVIALDEIWALLRGNAAEKSGEFILEIIKTIRAFAGAAITASQDLEDFFAYKGGEYGKAIISNSQTKFIMGLEDTAADFVVDTLHLTESESEQIRNFSKGEGLLIANKDHVIVDFLATDTEFMLCDTDRESLTQRRDELLRAEEKAV